MLELTAALNKLELAPTDAAAALAALEDLDGVLDVLDRRRRAGLVNREQLRRWHEPSYRRERAAALAGWRDRADRALLVDPLARGELPDEAAFAAVSELDEEVVILLLAARAQARADRDYARADRLRDLLRARAVELDDTPVGTRWRLAAAAPVS